MNRIAPAVLVAALCMWASGQALANGRFPASTSVQIQGENQGSGQGNGQANNKHIFVGVTFGLLISTDGQKFRWTCERNLGYDGTFDPKFRVDVSGTIYATTYTGVRASHDNGCSFALGTFDGGKPFNKWADAIDITSNGTVIIGTSDGGLPNDIYRSTDQGRTYSSTGLFSKVVWYKSVLAGKNGSSRVYASGYQVSAIDDRGNETTPRVRLFRSDNHGENWTELSIDDVSNSSTPLVMFEALDPNNASIVYARAIGSVGQPDILFRSTNGGDSWTSVFTTEPDDRIRNVVVTKNGAVWFTTLTHGLHKSGDGIAFTNLENSPKSACLGLDADDQILACGANWEPDFFALGRSANGTEFTKLVRFAEIAGPLVCPAGTFQKDICETELWPAVRDQFGIKEEEPVKPPDAPIEQPATKSGCCQSQAFASDTLAWSLLTLVWLVFMQRRTA